MLKYILTFRVVNFTQFKLFESTSHCLIRLAQQA